MVEYNERANFLDPGNKFGVFGHYVILSHPSLAFSVNTRFYSSQREFWCGKTQIWGKIYF